MAIEIVSFPIENGGSFHSYVNVYQRVFHITGGITHLRSGMMYNMVNRRISHSQITILMGGIPKTGRFIIGVSHSTAPSAPSGSHSLDRSRYGCAAAERIAGEAADRRESFSPVVGSGMDLYTDDDDDCYW